MTTLALCSHLSDQLDGRLSEVTGRVAGSEGVTVGSATFHDLTRKASD